MSKEYIDTKKTTVKTEADLREEKVKQMLQYLKEFPRTSDNTPRNREFEKIVKMTQPQLKKYCHKRLTKLGYETIENKDGFLYAEGKLPVLLVAHMDTVHFHSVKDIFYNKGRIYSSQGIGGDDRCGIYMILKILKTLKCHVLFTEDEEVGGIGAGKFTKTNKYKNINVNYILEFDRRGSNDAVFYECDNREFEDFVRSTKFFTSEYGTYSDICDVAPYLGKAAVNLSCGYYRAHTTEEYVVLDEMEQVIVEAKKLIQKDYETSYQYIEKQYGRNKWGSYDDWYDYYDNYYGYYGHSKQVNCFEDDDDYCMDEGLTGDETLYFYQNRDCEYESLYHIFFEDKETGYDKVAEITAVSKYEAIGAFLKHFKDYTFEDIKKVFKGFEESFIEK